MRATCLKIFIQTANGFVLQRHREERRNRTTVAFLFLFFLLLLFQSVSAGSVVVRPRSRARGSAAERCRAGVREVEPGVGCQSRARSDGGLRTRRALWKWEHHPKAPQLCRSVSDITSRPCYTTRPLTDDLHTARIKVSSCCFIVHRIRSVPQM